MAYYEPFDPNKLRQQSIMDIMNGGVFGGQSQDQSSPTFPNRGPSFDPYQAPSMPSQSVQSPQSAGTEDDINLDMQRRINLMNQFFPEQNQASDRFNQMINNAPQLNKPGFVDKLTAGLSGLGQYNKQTGMYVGGGPDVVNKVLYAPYLRDMAAWKEQLTPAQQAATLENTSNNINRQAGSTMVNAEVAADRVRQQEKSAAAKQAGVDEATKERSRIADAKQRLAEAKAQKPNITYKQDSGGYIYAIDDADPTHPIPTGLKGSDMSPMEKMMFGIAGQLALIDARGNQQRQTDAAKADDNTKPETGAQFTARQQIAAKTAWESADPTIRGIARRWLTRNSDATFDLKDMPEVNEGTFGFGKVTAQDVKDWQKVHDWMYPNTPAATPNTATPPAPAPGGGIQSAPSTVTVPRAQPSGQRLPPPQLPPPSGASSGQLGQFPGLFRIGQTDQSQMGPSIPDQVSPNAPKVGDRVGQADMQQMQQEQEQGIQAGQLAVVQSPDGKYHTVPVANVDRMLADPAFQGYRRVK